MNFNLAEEARIEGAKLKKKSQEHYLDYKLAPFRWDWLNKWGQKNVPTIWGKTSSYSNVLGTWDIYL